MIIECPRCRSRYDSTLKKPGAPISCRCGQTFYTPKLPSLAKAVNCPNCGGSASPDQNKCDYCGVYLAFARCPSCFSIAPYRGAKFCAECGNSLTQPAKAVQESAHKFACPRCNAGKAGARSKIYLETKKVGEYIVDSCTQCSGVWLDHTALDKILAQSNQQKSSQAVLGKSPVKVSDLPRHKVAYLACPECSEMMHRRNFAKRSGIIIDECTAHGIWFDKQELAAAIQFIRSSPEVIKYDDIKFGVNYKPPKTTHTKPASKPLKDNRVEITGGDLLDLFLELPSLFK